MNMVEFRVLSVWKIFLRCGDIQDEFDDEEDDEIIEVGGDLPL